MAKKYQFTAIPISASNGYWWITCQFILDWAFKKTKGLPARFALMHIGAVIHFVQTAPTKNHLTN